MFSRTHFDLRLLFSRFSGTVPASDTAEPAAHRYEYRTEQLLQQYYSVETRS